MCYIVILFEQGLTIYRFDSLVVILLVFLSTHGNEILNGPLTNKCWTNPIYDTRTFYGEIIHIWNILRRSTGANIKLHAGFVAHEQM